MLHQVQNGVIVDAALDDRIDLDRRESGGKRGLDTAQHLVERRESAAHALEYLLVQGIQAHCHALQAVGVQIHRMLAKQYAVSGQSDVIDAGNAGQIADQIGQVGAQQGFAAGEAQLAHPERGEKTREPHDFLERQALLRFQESIVLVILLLRHAIGAAEVAAIHDRDAQVVQWTREAIERIAGTANVVNCRFHGRSDYQRYTLVTKPFG